MEPKNLKEFGVFMSLLQETFSPDKPISDKRTEIYFEILSDIPFENIELGFKDLMNKKRYPIFPLPSEIRKAAGFDEEEDIDVKALEAFREACDFVIRYGRPEAKCERRDPLIEETIRLCFGSWEYFADTDPKNETWDRKQFLEIYKKLFQSEQRDSLLRSAKLMKELKENRENMKTLEEKK
ncbi:MAG: hypothetical protein KAR42_16990 [candidate division Zixibacteria bacterium]|nr:hypothetical protein [candidate division Zixibacteria bacterium]